MDIRVEGSGRVNRVCCELNGWAAAIQLRRRACGAVSATQVRLASANSLGVARVLARLRALLPSERRLSAGDDYFAVCMAVRCMRDGIAGTGKRKRAIDDRRDRSRVEELPERVEIGATGLRDEDPERSAADLPEQPCPKHAPDTAVGAVGYDDAGWAEQLAELAERVARDVVQNKIEPIGRGRDLFVLVVNDVVGTDRAH